MPLVWPLTKRSSQAKGSATLFLATQKDWSLRFAALVREPLALFRAPSLSAEAQTA